MIEIPRMHAFSKILYDGGKLEKYVHLYYKDMYKMAYEPIIHLVLSED